MSDKRKWTPAPWRVVEYPPAGKRNEYIYEYGVFSEDVEVVGYVDGRVRDVCDDHEFKQESEERCANAHLISSSPDLYEALVEILDQYHVDPEVPPGPFALKAARAAIRKARGGGDHE